MAQKIDDNFKDLNRRTRSSSSGRSGSSSRPSSGRTSGSNGNRSGSSSGRSSGSRSSSDTSRRQNTSGRNSGKNTDYEEEAYGAILRIVITVGIALFLTLCCVGACGSFGEAISGFLFGAFGFPAYVTPAFISFLIIWYIYASEDDDILPIRFTGCILLYLVIGMLSDMIGGATFKIDAYNVGDIYKICSEGKCGGGVISGSLSYALNSGIGSVGEVVICLLVLILSLFAINRQFFTMFFKNLFSGISDRSGEFVRNGMERAERRRQVSLESEDPPLLPYDEDADYDYPDEDATDDNELSEEESTALVPTVAEKMQRERKPAPKAKETPENGVIANFVKGHSQKIKEDRLRREAEKKVREETEDAEGILDVRKASREKNPFEKTHTGEMHEMSYVEDDNDDGYIDDADYTDEPSEEESYEESIKGTWADPAKRPGGSKKAEEPAEDYSPVLEIPKNVIPVRSDHKIVSTGMGEEEDPGEVSENVKSSAPSINEHRNESVQKPVINEPAPSKVPSSGRKSGGKFKYIPPSLELLKKGQASSKSADKEISSVQSKLVETLSSFGIEAEMGAYSQGPTVTRYEFTVSQGTKLSRIVNLSDEIKMALAATDIRIEAPIPGKSAIGIEVPNSSAVPVFLGDLLSSQEFKKSDATLSFAVGKDIEGRTVVSNIRKFPHILIAGTTGSGKSVCVNTLVLSLLYKSSPEDVQLILVDPKVVELKVYNGIPHLPFNVITKPKAAAEMLKWAVLEMERRYRMFADRGVRDIDGFNQYVVDVNAGRRDPEPVDIHEESDSLQPVLHKLPAIVIIIDELADLMMVAAKEVEESICRLAQLARAAGMHLVVATQRPSVDVITGLIKANMPSRLAFAVSSGVDSRTILDQVGAEKLLGKGDMLFYPQGKMKPDRLQGAFVSDEEVGRVTSYLRDKVSSDERFHNPLENVDGIENLKKTIKDIEAGIDVTPSSSSSSSSSSSGGVFGDDLFEEAGLFIIRSGKASIGYLQRVLKIGFNRAARIMDELAENGVVGQEQGTKPRDILMTEEMFTAYIAQKTSNDE